MSGTSVDRRRGHRLTDVGDSDLEVSGTSVWRLWKRGKGGYEKGESEAVKKMDERKWMMRRLRRNGICMVLREEAGKSSWCFHFFPLFFLPCRAFDVLLQKDLER